MPSLFPGMDPYLEQTAFWSSFHSRLIVAIADAIEPQLGTQYYVEVETRTYRSDEEAGEVLVGIPDAIVFSDAQVTPSDQAREISPESSVATQDKPQQVTLPMPVLVNERYLEVREVATDTVVTLIEVLSPKNKRAGDGREAYEKKRRMVLGSATHLVELDLLRGGKPMPMVGVQESTPYRILISRSQERPKADLYGVLLSQLLPTLPIPLKPDEVQPSIKLQDIFAGVYDRGRYGSRIDYRQPVPSPQLPSAEQTWVDTVLTNHRKDGETGNG